MAARDRAARRVRAALGLVAAGRDRAPAPLAGAAPACSSCARARRSRASRPARGRGTLTTVDVSRRAVVNARLNARLNRRADPRAARRPVRGRRAASASTSILANPPYVPGAAAAGARAGPRVGRRRGRPRRRGPHLRRGGGAPRAGRHAAARPLRRRRRRTRRSRPTPRPASSPTSRHASAARSVRLLSERRAELEARGQLLPGPDRPRRSSSCADESRREERRSDPIRHPDHGLPRRPAARPRAVPAGRSGRQRDRHGTADRRAVPVRQVAHAAVL